MPSHFKRWRLRDDVIKVNEIMKPKFGERRHTPICSTYFIKQEASTTFET